MPDIFIIAIIISLVAVVAFGLSWWFVAGSVATYLLYIIFEVAVETMRDHRNNL